MDTLRGGKILKAILNRAWQTWKRIGQAIGDFIARIVLTVFYFTLLMPFGIGVRIFSDPLTLRQETRLSWLERTTKDLTLDDARRQS